MFTVGLLVKKIPYEDIKRVNTNIYSLVVSIFLRRKWD